MNEPIKATSPGYRYASSRVLGVYFDPRRQKLHSSQEKAAMMLGQSQQ